MLHTKLRHTFFAWFMHLVAAAVVLAAARDAMGEDSGDSPVTLRVMTYNIHHGEGVDGKLDLKRIAELIRNEKADVVALQEVDRNTQRTGQRDIARELAELTDMHFVFGKNIDFQGGEYGNAILSRYTILSHVQTRYRVSIRGEQRGLLEAVVDVGGRPLRVLSTHLDFQKGDEERLANVEEALERLSVPDPKRPVVFCGDFNAPPESPTHRKVLERFVDCWSAVNQSHGFTIPSRFPMARIDYVFIEKQSLLAPQRAWVVQSLASDHLPVVVEFRLGKP